MAKEVMTLRVEPEDKAKYERAAAQQGMKLGEWIRSCCDCGVKVSEDEAGLKDLLSKKPLWGEGVTLNVPLGSEFPEQPRPPHLPNCTCLSCRPKK